MTKMNGNGLNMVFKMSLSVAHWVHPVYMKQIAYDHTLKEILEPKSKTNSIQLKFHQLLKSLILKNDVFFETESIKIFK